MGWKPHIGAAKRRRSAAKLVKLLLDASHDDLEISQIRELLGILIGKITEADGKLNTRHRSEGALGITDKDLLRHEHVLQKKKMIDELLNANSERTVDEILESAIGCVVTKSEHIQLDHSDDRDGWDRYRHARIRVRDLATDSWET